MLFDSSSTLATKGNSPQTKESVLLVRGGSDPYGSYDEPLGSYEDSPQYQQQRPFATEQQQQQQGYYNDNNPANNYGGDYQQQQSSYDDDFYANEVPITDPYQETVQDRVDRWKAAQAEMQQDLGPRDSQGRVKLLTSIGRGSRAFVFVLLILRDLYFYERTNNLSIGLFRFIATMSVLTMLLLNGAGVVASLSSGSHATKKRLKAILNLDKLVEIIAATSCFLRLLVPGKVPRELLVGSMFHSVFFFLNCQAITKFSWDETSARPISSYAAPAREQFY